MPAQEISFSSNDADARAIYKIAVRAGHMAHEHGRDYPIMDADMDLTAAHCNGTPLDLSALLAADDANFAHDVFGIRRHLNRKTGKLENCFSPRFSQR